MSTTLVLCCLQFIPLSVHGKTLDRELGAWRFWKIVLHFSWSLWPSGLHLDHDQIQPFSTHFNSARSVLHDSNERCWRFVPREVGGRSCRRHGVSTFCAYLCVFVRSFQRHDHRVQGDGICDGIWLVKISMSRLSYFFDTFQG